MITLFQHQQQALDETEGKNRVAYYLDMGLGKTFVGSEKMMKLNKRINLLVCQCSKVQDWIEHFQDHYAEFQGIMGSEQPEIEKAWNTTDDLLDNQFIPTAGNMGLSRWEKILGITPKGTDSLEDRRFRILTRINEELPYTLPQLRNILETLCGKGNYSADVEEGTYQLLVKIGLAAKNNFNDVESLLNRVVPQNMVVTLLQLYNTHAELGRFTHAQLAAYTHNQLRNEVLKNGE